MTSLVLTLVCISGWLGLWYVALAKTTTASSIRRGAGYFAKGLLALAAVAISYLGLMQSADELGPSWRAAVGQGTPGTFTADDTYEIGARYRTQVWLGTYVSVDKTVVREDIQLENPPDDMSLGSPVPALDTGAHRVVYGPGFPGSLLKTAIAPVIVVLAWTVAGWFAVRRARRVISDRRPRQAAVEPAPLPGATSRTFRRRQSRASRRQRSRSSPRRQRQAGG